MAIRITRNAEGNCITFVGSSNPAYWNSCLSAVASTESADRFHIINDIRTANDAETQYEFYNVLYTDFADRDGNPFTSRDATVTYVNENANVLGLTVDAPDLNATDINFRLDQTETSIIMDNGYQFGVNTIKAVADADGTIHIKSIGEGLPDESGDTADRTHFEGIEHGRVSINGVAQAGGINDVVNALNELFTVGPFEAIVISDPENTILADVQGINAGYTLEGAGVSDPITDDIAAGDSTHNNRAGVLSTATIDQAGEYFTFDMRVKGQIGFGLVIANEDWENYAIGNQTYADPSTFCNGVNSSHYGWQFSHHFHPTPNGPWTNYGANTSYVGGPGWTTTAGRFGNNEEATDWANGDPVKMKVGIDTNGFIEIAYYDNSESAWVMCARSAYTAPAGVEYKLGIKLPNSLVRVYSAPKVHLRAEDNTPTTIGDTTIDAFGGVTGNLAAGVIVATASGNNDGIITGQTISAAGEYFEFSASADNAHNVGLFYTDDYSTATVTADTADWTEGKYMFFGGKINTDEQYDSGVYKNGSGSGIPSVTLNRPTASVKYRVGFDTQGRATLWSSTDGTTFVESQRMSSAAPSGDYKFMWVGSSDGATLSSVSTGTLTSAPVMTFRYIESPDGVFHYPLFATAEEANYFDLNHDGTVGTGTSHTHVFIDEPTNTTWYMPDTGAAMSSSTDPSTLGSSAQFQGVTIAYTEITTLPDAQFAPAAFTDATVTVDELAAINVQVVPADASWTTTITNNDGSNFTLSGNSVTGTAPEVTGDNVTNPSDDYTVTITRSNAYGSSTGTLTVRVNNLTAPATAATGWTWDNTSTPLIDSDTLASLSIIDLDDTVGNGKRLIIPGTWVEQYVLPALQASGDTMFIGVRSAAFDTTSVSAVTDFDFVFRWQYYSASAHKMGITANGTFTETTINSTTDSYYDFAIEVTDDSVHMIACNVNAINTEPAVDNGGSFSLVYSDTSYTGTVPLQVMMMAQNTEADFSETGLSQIDIPAGTNDIAVTELTESSIELNGGAVTSVTLNAGNTYRFMLNDSSIESGDALTFETMDGTSYTTGVTTVGTHGDYFYYVQFAVPSDVPPLRIKWNGNVVGSPSISGSTYTQTITGVTQEGPAANQTGTNLYDSGDHGWLSIDEQLSAGERIVLSTTFLADLVDAMPDNGFLSFGIKDTSWTDTNDFSAGFEGPLRLSIVRYSSTDVRFYIIEQVGTSSITSTYTTTVAGVTSNNVSAFLEVTSSGNNIRGGFRADNISASGADSSTTAYADWDSNYKTQTGDQGYAITTVDVMVQGRQAVTSGTATMNSADVDWTALSEVAVPSTAPSRMTSWTKALDFSGSSERAQQSGSGVYPHPLMMSGSTAVHSAWVSNGNTHSSSNARPWAVTCVFKIDGNASNQHIWNHGEGAGSTDDNIYLRLDANKQLYFGWGRSGALNECVLSDLSSVTGEWHAVYIAHNGVRLSGANATATNLANMFDIHYARSGNNWTVSSNQSTWTNWNAGSTGGRMDRTVLGNFTIGGRGSNRNFHGKVAMCMVNTLKLNTPMPNTAEIEMMMTDPLQWQQDYMVGNTYRPANQGTNLTNYQIGSGQAVYAVQMWLMGDGVNDSYSNMIRNQADINDQNYTKLDLISMVSNDIETVSINGLS